MKRSKIYDGIEKSIFENRSIDHDRKSIFDRNHYTEQGSTKKRFPWILMAPCESTTWNYPKTVETAKLIFLPLRVSRYKNLILPNSLKIFFKFLQHSFPEVFLKFQQISGRPTLIVIETNINTVAAIIRDDRHMLVRMLKSMFNISKSSVCRILSEHLQMRRICFTWVLHFLTWEQMEQHVERVKEWVQWVRRDRNFLSKVITCDEIRVHHFDPKSKCESEVWRTSSSLETKKVRQ